MDAARAHGIPVVVVQNTAPAGAPIFVKGTPGWELHPVVASRPRDHYVEKSLPSAFAGTDLAQWIEARGINTLAVIGYMTHNCVDSTIKHALHSGIAVEYMQDASGADSLRQPCRLRHCARDPRRFRRGAAVALRGCAFNRRMGARHPRRGDAGARHNLRFEPACALAMSTFGSQRSLDPGN
jgi:hypothetical protein